MRPRRMSLRSRGWRVDPMLGNQRLPLSPTLHDRVREPVVLEVGVIERDDLELAT